MRRGQPFCYLTSKGRVTSDYVVTDEEFETVLSVRSENGKTKIADPWDPKIYGKGI